jgi:hypothetical protein
MGETGDDNKERVGHKFEKKEKEEREEFSHCL